MPFFEKKAHFSCVFRFFVVPLHSESKKSAIGLSKSAKLNRNASEAIFRLKSGGLEDINKSAIWSASESAEREAVMVESVDTRDLDPKEIFKTKGNECSGRNL